MTDLPNRQKYYESKQSTFQLIDRGLDDRISLPAGSDQGNDSIVIPACSWPESIKLAV